MPRKVIVPRSNIIAKLERENQSHAYYRKPDGRLVKIPKSFILGEED